MKPTPPTRHRHGFTLVELLVVITIIIILAALSFVGVTRMRDGARRAGSIANLRQLGVGFTSCFADNGGLLPLVRYNGVFWTQIVYPYVGSVNAFVHPGTTDSEYTATKPDGYLKLPDGVSSKTPEEIPIRTNYVINGGKDVLPFCEGSSSSPYYAMRAKGFSRPYASITEPARTIFLADGTTFWINDEDKTNSNRIRRWKNGNTNILWGDGSTSSVNPRDLKTYHFAAEK